MTTEERIKEKAERWTNYAWNHPTKDNGFHVIMKDAILSALTELSQELVRERDEAYSIRDEAEGVHKEWELCKKENNLLKTQLAEAVKHLSQVLDSTYCERAYEKMKQLRFAPYEDCECVNCTDARNAKVFLRTAISAAMNNTTKEEKR